MAVETFHCPECRALLRYSNDLVPGTMVRCPQCQQAFAVPDADAAPAPAAADPTGPDGGAITGEPGAARQSSQFTDDRGEEREPRRRYPDDDEDYPRPPRDEYGDRDIDAPLSNRYQMDLGKWFNIGAAHYSSVLGLVICFLLICAVDIIAVTVVGLFTVRATQIPASDYPLTFLNDIFITPALLAGLVAVALKQLDGRPWTFADFFAGFQGRFYGKILLNSVIMNLMMLPPNIALFLLMNVSMTPTSPMPVEMLLGILAFAVLYCLVAIYFFVRLFYFSVPLIMDRRLSAIDAIKGSWTLSSDHFWPLFGTYLVLSLLAGVGAVACYVGALFTIPLSLLVYVAGYLDMAGIDPPLPRPYRGDRWRENG